MSSLIGQTLGNFEIVSLLGKGGMATVYRARQLNIKREVAIKVIKPDLAESADFIRRFEREAETIASLGHPHILKLFEYGQHGDIVYLVTELLRGGSLAELIRKGPLPLETVSLILDQISSALDYAHSRQIIHRDLKPQNVLLDEQGNAFLTDFGIAKMVLQTTQLTQSGMAMGTPAYMAPEQWQTKASDARADIYALGIMLFEMLSGRLPFDGETPAQMMYMHLQSPPPLMQEFRADLPPSVEAVIEKALAKNREDRFQSAGEMAYAFKAALAGQTPVFVPVSQTPTPSRVARPSTPPSLARPTPARPVNDSTLTIPLQRHSVVLGIGVIALVLILIGGTAAVMLGGRPKETPTLTPSNTVIPMPTVQLSAPTVATIATVVNSPQPSVAVAAAPTQTSTVSPTITATSTTTPDLQETLNAMVNQTLTADVKSATPTASPTFSSTPTSVTASNTPSPSPTVSATFTTSPTASLTPAFTATLTTTSLTLTQIPCTVSTDKANKVPIRVGPGKSRGLRDYMAPNHAYQVIGQAQASDGSAWWKLKTDDNSEAWVAQADVKASGDCAQLAVVPTPAVQVARPKATNTPVPQAPPPSGGGGGSSGGGSSGDGGNPPPTNPPACGQPGDPCTGGSDCCSGSCETVSFFQCN